VTVEVAAANVRLQRPGVGRIEPAMVAAFGWMAVALLPLLIYVRGFGDVYLSTLATAFVVRLALRRDLAPIRAFYAWPALLYWGWLVAATAPSGDLHRIGVSLAWGRVAVTVVALGSWVLASGRFRGPLLVASAFAAVWIGVEVWMQALRGRSVSGFLPAPAGEFTGPFRRPRAGAYLVRIVWPPLAVACGRLSQMGPGGLVACTLLLAVFLATSFVIGQRMPLVHAALGVGILALALPALRHPAVVGAAAVIAVAALAATVFPAAFDRQVTQFAAILAGFPDSHYGQILRRALAMAEWAPWRGLGADGFRTFCADPRFFVGWVGQSDGGGSAMCVPHAHNSYLDALVNGGVPGLVLFALAAAGWLMSAAQRLLPQPEPLRLGLFISVLVPLWPAGSVHAFTSQPTSTLWALMTGWAIAEATRARTKDSARRSDA